MQRQTGLSMSGVVGVGGPRGTRIPVTMVAGLLAENVTIEAVLKLYPQLTAQDVVEIGELTKAIRRNVITSIERMTALEVTEVNITVNDVHVPSDDDDVDHESRVE